MAGAALGARPGCDASGGPSRSRHRHRAWHVGRALSRCLTPLEPDGTLIAVIEMSLSSWLVAGIVPGVERQPLKKLEVDESALLKLLNRWREEAEKAGHRIERNAAWAVSGHPPH